MGDRMATPRRYRQDLMRRGRIARAPILHRIHLVVLVFVALAMLVLSRIEHDYVRQIRWHVTEVMAPLLGFLSEPVEQVRRAGRTLAGAFDLADEVERLKDENRKLKGWEWRAIEAERGLAEIKSVSGLAKDQAMSFVTSRVIANSSGPFVRSALINVGEDNAVKAGYPALSADGLAGRIVEVGKASSQVLFLTDLNSRVPVHVGPGSVRAIVAGDNGPWPRLSYVPALAQVRPGDEVSTSGIGGIFPRGLRIGVVVKDNDILRVKPYAELDRLEFLSVIFYENPTLSLIEEGRSKSRAAFQRDEDGIDQPREDSR